ncbi:hypothetical protein ABZ807_19695 [Micromonospora sp. NPDC047548]|uniref:hypothetical protein n=1 Tax=Micromonospora sp. NPDC047548 TaxID=3155624 RepID=UPI0033F81BEA
MSRTVTIGRRRWGALRVPVVMAALLSLVVPAVAVPHGPVAYADAARGGGDYVPLTGPQATVLDTRNGAGGTTGVRGAASTTTFPVLGVGGIPTSGVSAVLTRVAVVDPTAATFLEMWPDGISRPGSWTVLSAGTGEDISNIAVVKVGANGKMSVYNNAGKTHIVVQVQGYFKSTLGSTGGGFVPLAHTRLVDTRSGLGTTTGAIAAGGSRTITITGGLVPAGSAAALVNVGVPGATAAGSLSMTPVGYATRSLLNYVVGSTQSGAVLTLPADGRVTVTNNGSAAVHLMFNVEGYFTKTPTQGAGLRPVANRLINTRNVGAGVPVAANGILDVQVGGTNGLPTRGIAGAAIAVTVTPAAAGYLKVWPAGEAEASLTVMDFKAGTWRTNALVIKPGTDGKIRIRNGSSSTAHFAVDLQGWYADPLPAVPVAQDTPTTVLQAAPLTGAAAGTIEYAYVDNAGRVVYGHQSDLDNFNSTQWTVISGNEAFSGQPALTQLADGRIQVTAQYRDGDIWSISQTAPGGPAWNAWTDLGGSMASPPAAGKLADGTVVQFAVDADGKLWAYAQAGAVPYWRNLGDQNLTGQVSVVAVRDGLRVFARNGQGAVKSVLYYHDGSLSGWTDLGGTGLTGVPAVVVRPGYQLQVFVRAANGSIVAKLQDVNGVWPEDWQSIGTFAPDAEVVPAAGAPAAIMDPSRGRLAVVVRGTTNEIYQVWETATGTNAWGNWTKGVDVSDPAATDPTAMSYRNVNNQAWLVAFRNFNGASRIYDLQASGM